MGRKSLYVRLIRHSLSPEEIVAMGAKLCYSPIDVDALETGVQSKEQGGFVRKLMDLGHMSPLEHAVFTYAIEGVSRSLLAQITRHRIASFSVQSQRYVSEHSVIGGEGFDYIIPPRIENLGREYVEIYQQQMQKIQEWYDFWLEKLNETGEAGQEDARFVLPNAAETKLIVTMNARELLHFFRLRCCNRAQWEIHQLADRMLIEAKKIAPNVFQNAGPGCLSGICPEGKMTCGKITEVREIYARY